MENTFAKILLASALCVAALSANATPVSFNFAVADPLPLAANTQAQSGGVTVTVSAGSSNGAAAVINEDTNPSNGYDGLGVDTGSLDGSNNDVNTGTGYREWLTFSFSTDVSLDKISFTNVDSNEQVILSYLTGANIWVSLATIPMGNVSDFTYDLSPDLLASAFRVTAEPTATGATSEFRVTSLLINTQDNAVPEPTTIALAGAALLGLLARRRR